MEVQEIQIAPTEPAKPLLNDRYRMVCRIGRGSYGSVYKVEDTKYESDDYKYVAIKKMRLSNRQLYEQGIDFTTLREIKILQEIKHENIIALTDVFYIKNTTFMAMELAETDLWQLLIMKEIPLSVEHIKCIMLQILNGLKVLHSHWIIHRDLTPNNILISKNGVLKYSDFGLSRLFAAHDRPMTKNVVTLHYRAPEILFGANYYGPEVDIWAAGCILGGLITREILFCGGDDIDQLGRIFSVLGTPSETTWKGVSNLPSYVEFEKCEPQPFKALFQGMDPNLLDLMSQMLILDPNNRITLEDALDHPFFTESPDP